MLPAWAFRQWGSLPWEWWPWQCAGTAHAQAWELLLECPWLLRLQAFLPLFWSKNKYKQQDQENSRIHYYKSLSDFRQKFTQLFRSDTIFRQSTLCPSTVFDPFCFEWAQKPLYHWSKFSSNRFEASSSDTSICKRMLRKRVWKTGQENGFRECVHLFETTFAIGKMSQWLISM